MSSTTVVTIAEVIVPDVFTAYSQQITQEKAAIINSGVAVRDAVLDNLLAGGGTTFHVPSWQDLDASDTSSSDNVSSDDPTSSVTTHNTKAGAEIAVRLSRNQAWSTMDLATDLSGSDPAASIAGRVGYYWTRRMQAGFVATMTGIFAENHTATVAGEHVQDDMTHDVSNGGSYSAGVTDFSAGAFIDAAVTMGDSMEELGMVMMHSLVYAKALKNNLIDFIPDSTNPDAQKIATFLGRRVVVDDHMPNSTGTFQTWLFGAGAVRLGIGSPKIPTETLRIPGAGNGSGQENLYNRVQWSIHPVGHKYVGTPATAGGPTNATSSNNLANAASWLRVFPERKQIKIARLITQEF